jgi:hypothetical protein
MAADTYTLIGHITDVQDARLIGEVDLDADSKFPIIEVEGNRIQVGQIGSHVSIRQPGIHILARIARASKQKGGAITSDDKGEENASRYGLLSLVPLGEYDESGAFTRGVSRFPAPGAEIHVVVEEELAPVFSGFVETGFDLGYLPTMPSVHVSLNPTSLLGRHTAILGQSGAGKSWGVASLIQRTVKAMPRAHVILLDLHGEYHWNGEGGQRQSVFDDDIVRYVDAREMEIPYWLLTFSELVDIFIDRSEEHASVQIAFFRDLVHTLRKKGNKDMNAASISIDTPVYFSLADMFRHIKHANEQSFDFGKTKGPLHGKFDNLLMRMHSKLNDVRYDFLFRPKKRTRSDTMPDLLRDFVGLGKKRSQVTVIDLSPVPFDVRPTVSAQIGRLAFEFNYWNPQHREFPILLVCEEAHAYIPREHDITHRGTRRAMERIAKEGRKYGVSLAVVSQRPYELSETVLAQCVNYLCFRITNPDDQGYVKSLLPDAERTLLDTLTSLARGEVLALGEAVTVPLRFQMFKPDPAPNSGDIDVYSQWKEGPEDLDVDAIVENWRLQRR